MKAGFKALVDIFKVFYKAFFFYHCKSENSVNSHVKNVFRNKMFHKLGYKWYMNKPFCKDRHIIDKKKAEEFGGWEVIIDTTICVYKYICKYFICIVFLL